MKHKVYKRYKTRKNGGQHYHMGRKNYGMPTYISKRRPLEFFGLDDKSIIEDVEHGAITPDRPYITKVKTSKPLPDKFIKEWDLEKIEEHTNQNYGSFVGKSPNLKGKNLLFHKTELRAAKEISKSGSIEPGIGMPIVSTSIIENPIIEFKKFDEPIVLVIDRDKLDSSRVVKPGEEFGDLATFEAEKEVVTDRVPKGAILGAFIHEDIYRIVRPKGKGHPNEEYPVVAFPTRFVDIKNIGNVKFKEKRTDRPGLYADGKVH